MAKAAVVYDNFASGALNAATECAACKVGEGGELNHSRLDALGGNDTAAFTVGRSAVRLAAVAFAAGVWALQRQPELPGGAAWTACVLLAGLALLVAVRIHVPGWRLAAIATLMLSLGFGYAALRAELRLDDALSPDIEGRDVIVTGVIAGLPQPFERGVRFEFDVESAGLHDSQVPRRIQLAWYNGLDPEEFHDLQPVRAGERWRFTVRLRRPHGSANAHGFDYEAWLLERGIRATGYVRANRNSGGQRERLDHFVWRPTYAVERLREAIRDRFRKALPDYPWAGVLVALAIGDQRAIDAEDWQVFARTGVSHLMSISGLHVTMVSGLFAALVLALWRRVPLLALRLPAQKAAAIAGMLAAFAYCVLSGFAVPAQRTLYMISVVAMALWLDRFSSSSRVLALALLVVLLLDPWAVLSPGFWLSFGAVGLIFYVGSGRLQQRGWLRQWSVVQWAVTVGLAPLLLALFGQVSMASPIANAVAIPLVSLVVTPLALAGAIIPDVLQGDALLKLAHAVFDALMPLLQWLSGWPGAVWQQHAPAAWTVPLALLGIAWLLAPRGFPARTLGMALMVPMFAILPRAPQPGELWLTVLDVGQGLAIVARTANHALLYDAGPLWSPQADSGSRIIVPWLRGEGISRLDMLAISHDDSDHAGGAGSVIAAIDVAQQVSSVPPQRLPQSTVPYRLPCVAGQTWEWDDVKFAWLHPGASEAGLKKVNDRSCVLRIEAGGKTALLTGDIEKPAEQLLMQRGAKLAADVLTVPHHGSGTSSTPAFVHAVSPQHAVFTVGYRNRFGHPKGEVWARYADVERHRSDRDGAVTFRFGEAGIATEREREVRRRYWQGR